MAYMYVCTPIYDIMGTYTNIQHKIICIYHIYICLFYIYTEKGERESNAKWGRERKRKRESDERMCVCVYV